MPSKTPGFGDSSSPNRERVRFLRFVIAAGLSVPVNLLARVALSTVVAYELAVVLSHVVGMLVAWGLTRLFVFEPSGAPMRVELGRFALVNVVSGAVTWLVAVGLLRTVFPAIGFVEQTELVAHVAGLTVSAIASFFGHRAFSFRRASLR